MAVAVLGVAYLSWLMILDKMSYDLYTNEKEGISMKYPKGWKVTPYPNTGAIVVMVKPKENPLVLFQANWNISATRLPEPLTLDQYVKASNAQVQFMFKDAQATAYPVRLSGHDGRKIVYISADPEGMVILNYVFIYKGVAYNIMYIDSKDAYLDPKKSKAVTDVIHSLKVKF